MSAVGYYKSLMNKVAPAAGFIVDDYPDVTIAAGTLQMSASHQGLNVRTDFTSTYTDIGYDNEFSNETAIIGLGASIARVQIMYDAANGYDGKSQGLTAGGTTLRIYESSAVNKFSMGNKPAMRFLSTDQRFEFPTTQFKNEFTVFFVLERDSTTGRRIILATDTYGASGKNSFGILRENSSILFAEYTSGSLSLKSSTASIDLNVPAVVAVSRSSTDLKFYVDGVLKTTTPLSGLTYEYNYLDLGSLRSGSATTGLIGSFIYFDVNKDSDVEDISNYLIDKFGI